MSDLDGTGRCFASWVIGSHNRQGNGFVTNRVASTGHPPERHETKAFAKVNVKPWSLMDRPRPATHIFFTTTTCF